MSDVAELNSLNKYRPALCGHNLPEKRMSFQTSEQNLLTTSIDSNMQTFRSSDQLTSESIHYAFL